MKVKKEGFGEIEGESKSRNKTPSKGKLKWPFHNTTQREKG